MPLTLDAVDTVGKVEAVVRFTPSLKSIRLVALTHLTRQTLRGGAQLDDRELSPREVAEELNVSASTVRRWKKAGIITPTRVLPSKYQRYSRQYVEEFRQRLERGEIDAKTGI
jgi:hypothetical protein